MKYLLDKNVLTNDLIENISRRDDLCVTYDVLEEARFTDTEIANIKNARIQVVNITAKHLHRLMEVMTAHGNNLKLINLYTGKGTADVVMIAYVLAESHNPETLFKEEYTIVTKDKELIAIAESYGIKCIPEIV